MRRAFLLDTNHLSAAINPASRLRERIYREHRAGARIRTCVPVICELEVAIQDSSHIDSYRRQLTHVLDVVRVLPLDLAISQRYGEVFREMRQIGRVLSQVDMILAAMLRHLNYTLLTTDRDFEAIPDIRTENWLT